MSISKFTRLIRSRGFATSSPAGALSASVRPRAEQISTHWKGTSATGGTTKNFIGGQFIESKASEWFDVLDPVRLRFVCRRCCVSHRILVYADSPVESAADH
jgi:malonate-semialdehyde dehydrogenase (acetylating) / methylmalonate-semialdehyde dehydrogenase